MQINDIINDIRNTNTRRIIIDTLDKSMTQKLATVIGASLKGKVHALTTLDDVIKNEHIVGYGDSIITKHAKSQLGSGDLLKACANIEKHNIIHIVTILHPKLLAAARKQPQNLDAIIEETTLFEEALREIYRLTPSERILAYSGHIDFISYSLGVHFIEESHQYVYKRKDGMSVTSIVGMFSHERPPSEEVMKRIIAAGKRGTAIHKYIETYYRYGVEFLDDFSEETILSIGNRLNEGYKGHVAFNPVPQFLEFKFVDAKGGYAGTIDFVGYIGDDLGIIDGKTQAVPTIGKWTMQLNAYARAFKKYFGRLQIPPQNIRLGILHLPKNSKTFYEIINSKKYQNEFMTMCRILKNQKKIEIKAVISRV